jgi:hypothetical protein
MQFVLELCWLAAAVNQNALPAAHMVVVQQQARVAHIVKKLWQHRADRQH